MLKIYGTRKCKDCITCIKTFDSKGIAYEFLDVVDNFDYFKEFIRLRDTNTIFDGAKEKGGIGIPCIRKEDGSYTLDWESVM